MMAESNDRIKFEVETSRVLEILSKEIYDSPYALLRENLQNAYDAILIRSTIQRTRLESHSIAIEISNNRLVVQDNGVGMDESTLRQNYWKAGSSGKRTELASRAGVIGTFGIGAMANFGVCSSLVVRTRQIDSDITIVSCAHRDQLRISEDCIELQRVYKSMEYGTTIEAELVPEFPLTPTQAKEYLSSYVQFLPVRVTVNGQLISQKKYWRISF